jgi:hypothetical protein
MGGGPDCGSDDYPAFFPTWGTRNEDGPTNNSPRVHMGSHWQLNLAQMQWDAADWPCYAKYAAKFAMPSLGSNEVYSATFEIWQFGNPGYGAAYADDGTKDTVFELYRISPNWGEMTINWDNAPLPQENLARRLIPPLPDTCAPTPYFYCQPPVKHTFDITELVRRCKADSAAECSFLISTSAGQYHSGKFVYSREVSEWPPTVRIAYAAANAPTPTPTTPSTATPTTTPAPLPVLDNFNRTLLGTNWAGGTNSLIGYTIAGNELLMGGSRPIFWQPTTFGANQRVTVTLAYLDPTATHIGLALKANDAYTRMLEAEYVVGSGVRFWTLDPDWQTTSYISTTLAGGDLWSFEALDNGDVRTYKNGAFVGGRTVSYSGNSSGGKAGVYAWSSAQSRIDDFNATNVGAPLVGATVTPTPQPVTPTPTLPPTITPTPQATATPGGPTPTPTLTPTPVVGAKTYYIGPNGDDRNSGLTIDKPWKTFPQAWPRLYPGDTLLLLDGVYTFGTTGLIQPNVRNGTQAAPITIRALNDGKAVIDGENRVHADNVPVRFGANWLGGQAYGDWFTLDGVVAINGYISNIRAEHATGIVFRRVSAYNANTDINSLTISAVWSDNVLIEDCIAGGTGRYGIGIFTSTNVTVRRCFSMWRQWDGKNFCGVQWPNGNNIGIYNSSNSTVENSVAYGRALTGIFTQANNLEAAAGGNKMIGNVSVLTGRNYDNTKWLYGAGVEQPTTRPGPTANPYPPYASCDTHTTKWYDGGHRTNYSLYGQGFVNETEVRDNIGLDGEGICMSVNAVWETGRETTWANNTIANNTCRNSGTSLAVWELPETWANRMGPNAFSNVQSYPGWVTWSENILPGPLISTVLPQPSQYQGQGANMSYRYVDGIRTLAPLLPLPMEGRLQQEAGLSWGQVINTAINRAAGGTQAWPIPQGGTFLGAP